MDEMEAIARVHVITTFSTRTALRATFSYGMSWFDSLIFAAALEADCKVIYTEDLPGSTEIEGIRYVNPFADE